MNLGDTVAGKYRLDRLLGEGGMGAVYAAENLNTGRRVAIKVLHGEWTQRPEVVQRFLREARATTTIAHPNVVEVLDLDVDRDRGIPYIVQEFLEGETLEAHLGTRPGRRLEPAEALRLLLPVIGALVAAHARGVVHRDLKPANLFIARSRGGEVVPKVIDFGIAKSVDAPGGSSQHTQAGTAIGTPGYMSPEQVSGLPDVDAQTDVWSLGVVLYEALAGRLPFESPNVNVQMAKILYEAPTPLATVAPSVPDDLAAVVHTALQRERPHRFASMRAMLAAVLETGAAAGVGAASLPSAEERLRASLAPPQPSTGPHTPAVARTAAVPGMEGRSTPVTPSPTVPVQGLATPVGTLPVQGLARPQPTQPMASPASNPWSGTPSSSSSPGLAPPDTMTAQAVTSGPASTPSRRLGRTVAVAFAATLVALVVIAAVALRGEPQRAPAQTAAMPTQTASRAEVPVLVAPPVRLAASTASVAAPPTPSPPVVAVPAVPVVVAPVPPAPVEPPPLARAPRRVPRGRPRGAARSNALAVPQFPMPRAPSVPSTRALNADEI